MVGSPNLELRTHVPAVATHRIAAFLREFLWVGCVTGT